jgi:GH24 family phage-related lysozyme (muramidase)
MAECQNATSSQSCVDGNPAGNPATAEQIAENKNIREKQEEVKPPIEEKIVSVKWNDNAGKTIKEAFYNEEILIQITTENLNGKEITVTILDDKKNKITDWDKAKEDDTVLKATISNNAATVKFTPKDEWFSKGAKDKPIIASASCDGKQASSSVLTVKKVNYNKDMIFSDNGLKFTSYFETLAMICTDNKIRAYQDNEKVCGEGVWTVGFGEAETGGEITKDTVIENETEAWNRFVTNIKGRYSRTTRANLRDQGVKRNLMQYEFDALVDYTYNAGNCTQIAKKIAENADIGESDFGKYKNKNRKKLAFELFSGETITIKGYAKRYRKDNTNAGYCPIPTQEQETKKVTKDGKTVEEPVFEEIDGKKVPKMKTKQGWRHEDSKDTYTLQY